ncbi:VOC family protein [Clostridium paridis]|uniref:VOC family protein n=1 Tax=Clostridium paridis TaxID=2803863 RepID=A0A937FHG2_9CLOT|nr:VOC family protein [Clostridium paridis]MBL4933085.1 VOC family protein [Clostridium paridis]
MGTKIFVNLPVKDLKKSVDFFTKLGFTFNHQFTDENAACMIINEDIFAMLLVDEFFKNFTQKEITDTTKSTEVILGLSAESKAMVDVIVDKAINMGGKFSKEAVDFGHMYQRSFQDLDGHLWEFIYMDPEAIKEDEELASLVQ